MNLAPKNTYLLIGLAGIGMSAMALLLKKRGYPVSGLDRVSSPYLASLEEEGIRVIRDENDICWENVCEVIYTSAVNKSNPLLAAAQKKGISCVKRGEKLASFLNDARFSAAVTGTHGKTTTSALLAHLFIGSGLGTEMYIGGIPKNYGSNYYFSGKDHFVAEIDESDKTFELMRPLMALVTNVEYEHVDRYGDFQDLLNAFRQFFTGIQASGMVFYNKDDRYIPDLLSSTKAEPVMVSQDTLSSNAFACYEWNEKQTKGKIALKSGTDFQINSFHLMGWHNMENAALAVACASKSGISAESIQLGLDTFQGVKRRFESLTSVNSSVQMISDYAHHPTEVEKTLSAARSFCGDRKICAVFQPHRISRLKFFFEEFATAFREADYVIVTEIYLASEEGDPFLLSRKFVETLSGEIGGKAIFSELKDLKSAIGRVMGKAEMILFLGAGSIDGEARKLAADYEKN